MKFFVVLALVAAAVAMCAAVPQSPSDAGAVVTRYDNDNIGVDGYNYGYETSNGISASEQGTVNNAGTDNEALSARGQFSYTGPDGVVYSVTYIANENGFQPSGAHLPTPPSV